MDLFFYLKIFFYVLLNDIKFLYNLSYVIFNQFVQFIQFIQFLLSHFLVLKMQLLSSFSCLFLPKVINFIILHFN